MSSGAEYPAAAKANGTTKTGKTRNGDLVEDHGVEFRQSKWDWTLPGLGSKGGDCGANTVPEKNAVCKNGDSVRYSPLRCKRLECPECYEREQLQQLVKMVIELEGRARMIDERPHALTFSVKPDEARTWSYERLNSSLFRRGYRRMRDLGIDGGVAIFHPWRIPDKTQSLLRKRGYGVGGRKGGLWNGVREDALDRGDPRKYVKFGPHGHNIGFPEYIDSDDESGDFIIDKYDELDTLGDVIGHLRYLMSHRGIRTGETGRSIRRWGAFNARGEEWNGAKEELSESDYQQLVDDVCDELGIDDWESESGEIVIESDSGCPECGCSVEEFWDMRDLVSEVRSKSLGRPWLDSLSGDRRRFFESLADAYRDLWNDEEKDHLVADELDPPDSVTVWTDEELDELEIVSE